MVWAVSGSHNSPEILTATLLVSLRATSDPSAQQAAVAKAIRQLVDYKPHFSKAEAARILGVSAPTLDKWVATGLLPVLQTPEYKRERVPAKLLLELAAEVKKLRLMGRRRLLLPRALSRLEAENPQWQAEFSELYSPAHAVSDKYVSPAFDWDLAELAGTSLDPAWDPAWSPDD
jgi:hypothetical protein